MSNQYPVILCHGLLGWGKTVLPLKYWGTATAVDSFGLPVFEAGVGPVSSFHDRACELAAQIKGERVDYGERHAAEFGHERHSNDFTGKGFHPSWSEENPVHLVGHSAGAHTSLRLQHLLANDYWGWGSNANWVKSISSVSGVLNGSTATYLFGCSQQTGLVENGSIADFLSKAIKPLAMVSGGIFESIYDWNLDQWGLHPTNGESLLSFLARLNNSGFGKGKDNLAFDLTLQGCYEANQITRTGSNTHYFSHVTEQTSKKLPFDKSHYPDVLMNPAFLATATYIGQAKEFSVAPIPGWGKGDLVIEKWVENDGLVPSISQRYPFTAGDPPFQESGIHTRSRFEPGGWYWEKVEDQSGRSWDHIDVVFGILSQPTLIGKQMEFYKSMYKRLADLP